MYNIFNFAQIGLFRTDFDTGIILEGNDYFAHLLGYKDREALLVAKATVAYFYKNIGEREYMKKQLTTHGKINNFETLFEVNHQQVWVKVSASYDNSNNSLYGVIEDFTAEKENRDKLRENEAMFRTVFENVNDAIFIIKDKTIFSCNKKAKDALNLSIDQIIGTEVLNYFPKRQPDGVLSSEKAEQYYYDAFYKPQQFDWACLGHNNELIYTQIGLNTIKIQSESYVLAIVHDITQRVKHEQSLMESEERYRKLFINSNDSIIIAKNNVALDCNDRTYEIFNIADKDITKLTFENIHPKYQSNGCLSAVEGAKRVEQVMQGNPQAFEWTHRRLTGEEFCAEIRISKVDFPEQGCFQLIIRDISERKEVERKITVALIEGEEKERKRIAQDLHDEIGPLISTLNLYLTSLYKIDNQAKRSDYYTKIEEILKETNNRIRDISNDLSPHLLINFGLHKAIKSLINRIDPFMVINFQSTIENQRLNENIELIFYRITSELINNTLKHANASEIDIKIGLKNNILELKFSNNGVGFDIEKAIHEKKTSKKGIGLFNIIARIESLGGTYTFKNLQSGIEFHFKINI